MLSVFLAMLSRAVFLLILFGRGLAGMLAGCSFTLLRAVRVVHGFVPVEGGHAMK